LRERLQARRQAFVAGPTFGEANAGLARHLVAVVSELEPSCLGVYWPHRSEFNAVAALAADSLLAELPISLPFAQRGPVRMHYRAWNGQAPEAVDDCGLPASSGVPVEPDVVLVPCLGFTASGHRLGYGGGYFDRWLAQHPDVTAVGVAWAVAALDADEFVPDTHDQPLTLIVTEHGVT
jgi:5,10-methenyltetrahydrofolate synthetase